MRAVQDAVFSGKRSYSGVHIRAARQLLARQTQDNNATTSSVTETQSTTDLNDPSSTALVSTLASNSTSTLTSTSSGTSSGVSIAAEPTSTTETLSTLLVSTTATDSATVSSTTESTTTSTTVESTSSTSTSSSLDSETTVQINGGFAPAATPAAFGTASSSTSSAATQSTATSTSAQDQPKQTESPAATAQNGASNDSQGQDSQGQGSNNGNQGGAQAANDQQGSDNSGTTSGNKDQATDSSGSSSSETPAATAASANSDTNQGSGQDSNGNAGAQGQPQETSSKNGGGNASITSTSGSGSGAATLPLVTATNNDITLTASVSGTSALPSSTNGSEGASSAVTSTGRIAGVTVGALALVAVVTAILFFVVRRWRNRRDQVYDPEKRSGSPKRFTTQTINSFLGGPNTARLTVPATFNAPPQIYTQFDDRPISFVPSTTGSVPGAGMAIGSPSQMRTHTNLPGHDSLTVPIGPSTSGNPYSPSPSPIRYPASPASIEPGFEFVTPQPAMIQTVNAKNYGTASGSPTQSFNSQTIDFGYASPGIQRYSSGSDEVVISPQTQMAMQDPFRDQNPFSDPQQVRRGPGGGLWIQRPVQ